MGIELDLTNQSNQLITSRKGSNVVETRGDTGKVSESGGDTKTRKDTLELSKMASILSSSIEDKAFDKPVNQPRVDKLRADIKSGNYQVKAEVVANKFFRFEAGF